MYKLALMNVIDFLATEQELVAAINAAIRRGIAENTVEELMNSEAQLPLVYPTAASLYQSELFSLQNRSKVCFLDFGAYACDNDYVIN